MGMRGMRGWFGRSDREYREEIEQHIELETQANIERGMTPEAARLAARKTFGNSGALSDSLQDARPFHWIGSLAQDVRYGCRMIRRNKLLSSAVVLTLSLGIGITTGIFSLVNAFVFRPPVSENPESFFSFQVIGDDDPLDAVSTGQYEAFRDRSRSVDELAAWSRYPVNGALGPADSGPGETEKTQAPFPPLSGVVQLAGAPGDADEIQGLLVTCNFFTVFGPAPPILGRLLQQDDCSAAQPVAVISAELWRNRFAADPSILGQSILYGGRPLVVAGVVERLPARDVSWHADIWLPYTLQPWMGDAVIFSQGRNWLLEDDPWLEMAGRLLPENARAAATEEFRAIDSGLENPIGMRASRIVLTDGSEWAAGRVPLWEIVLLLALPNLILVIASVNVATLLLARAAGRQQEMAIRLALGTSRWRLIRMLLVENGLLAGAAALGSLVLVYRIPQVVVLFLQVNDLPPQLDPDWRVFVYLGSAALLATVCSGLSPALESLNLEVSQSLNRRQRFFGKYGNVRRMRSILVGAQVALGIVPLIGAAMSVRVEQRLADPGFEMRQVYSVEIRGAGPHGDALQTLGEIASALPAATAVAYSDGYPLLTESGVRLGGEGQAQFIRTAQVSPGYFRTMGIPILAGRSFEDAENAPDASIRPVVVSQRFAQRFFGNENPLGRQLELASGPAQIVGIAGNRMTDSKFIVIPDIDDAFIYQLMPEPYRNYLLVRFEGDADAFDASLQSAIRAASGPPVWAATIQSRIDASYEQNRRMRTLILILSGLALTLALLGVFSIVSFVTNQRRKEIAIRIALGARPADVVRTILASASRPVPIGMLAGLLLSWAGFRFAAENRMLPTGMQTADPVPYIAVLLLMLLTTAAAMFIPALRATRSDPVRSLREE